MSTDTSDSLSSTPPAQLREEDGPKVFIETFGCQMNLLDTELVRDQLRDKGYRFTPTPDNADVVLYNTCSVRDLSEQKVLSRLGRMKIEKDEGRKLVVGVLGCMAERIGEQLQHKLPHVDLMCGPSELDKIPALLDGIRGGKKAVSALSGHNNRRHSTVDAAEERLEALDRGRFLDPDQNAPSRQAYVRITRGCNKFCSFCVVPFTRGEEVHRPPDGIVDEVKRLADTGVVEVTLLGQTINHYSYGNTTFAELLRRVHDEVPHLQRLRFLTSYPRDFTDEALDVMAASDRMSRFLHIPAQSGNDRVLKKMNRGYTRDIYLSLIERARARMPDIAIVGDMIVGFPTETDEEFEDSLSLLREVRYKMVYVFKYSPRDGTVANKKLPDDVTTEQKRARNNAMLQLQQEISLEHHQAMVGQTVDVLVEGAAKIDPEAREIDAKAKASGLVTLGRRDGKVRLTSRTRGDHIVAFDGPSSLVGTIVPVRVDAARALSLTGTLVQ